MPVPARRRRRRKNLGPLGWTAVALGSVVAIGLVGTGVVFYRMTRM